MAEEVVAAVCVGCGTNAVDDGTDGAVGGIDRQHGSGEFGEVLQESGAAVELAFRPGAAIGLECHGSHVRHGAGKVGFALGPDAWAADVLNAEGTHDMAFDADGAVEH